MKKTLSCKKGFTLIEVMCVLILLGVVAAVAYGKFSSPIASQQQGAGATIAGRDLTDIVNGIQAYELANAGQAPATIAALSPTYLTTVPPAPTQVPGSAAYALGTVASRTAVTSATTDVNICEAINTQYAGIAAGTAPVAAVGTLDIQCSGTTSPYVISKFYN
jgi:prepilin-type N-terminal cleavage/methylation domain-containing protein